MAGRLVPVRVGDVELLVETVPVAGSEQTAGRLDGAAQRVVDAFESAQRAIEAVSERVADTVAVLGSRAVRPESLAVEFGLKFTASGGVVVAGASAEASLKVTVTYTRRAASAPVDPVDSAASPARAEPPAATDPSAEPKPDVPLAGD